MGAPSGDADWSAAHQHIDPAGVPFLAPWLRGVDVLARPLVAGRVPPDAVTALGLLSSLAAPALARGDRPGVAVPFILASVVLDALDGAVARATGHTSTYGRALDSACDRTSELAWWVALERVGVSRVWLAPTALLTVGMERWRAHRGRFGTLTVWERPSRTMLAVLGLAAASRVAAGRVPARLAGVRHGDITGAVGLGLACVGAAQLVRAAAQGS